MPEQVKVFYSGHVQGVGFRMTCRSLARNFPVTGFVRNLSDGRVELEAEGETRDLKAFLEAIRKSQLARFIRNEQEVWSFAEKRHLDFSII